MKILPLKQMQIKGEIMDRLTEKIDNLYERKSVRVKNQQLIDKLGAYEDAEENGLLLKLPCKAGDTVYIVSRQEVIPLKINGIYVNENSIAMYGVNEQHYGYGKVTLYSNKTPIEWFTTKEEAEDFLESLESKRK